MSGVISTPLPWVAKWGEGVRFDGGGQGDTFLVPDRTTPRGVMKLLKDIRATDPKSRRRMFQEVSNLKILHSAGARVPQILDDNTSEFENLGVPLFFVMERIEGKTLAQLVEERKRFEFGTALALTISLCKTFEIAFRERISHRDIKPENLIVTSLESCQVVVVDFGLSFNEETGGALTEVGEALDNKFISLPERRGPGENKRDPRSDITGICAILFFCLTGCAPRNLKDSKNRPPHRWENFMMDGIGPTPNHVALLNALFDRGFNYELQNRFQTLEEFLQRVNELLQTSPSLPTETLEIIAQRESAFFYETDRKTLLAKLRADSQVVTNSINQTFQSVSKKLTGTLFGLANAQMYQSLDPKDGDEIWGRHFDLRVQNHIVLVRIQFFIACKGSECVALRRISDLSQNNQVLRTLTSVLTRYDSRLGKPDANLIASDLEVAVGVAIPRLRALTQS